MKEHFSFVFSSTMGLPLLFITKYKHILSRSSRQSLSNFHQILAKKVGKRVFEVAICVYFLS